jgi:virginiamycin B lyase
MGQRNGVAGRFSPRSQSMTIVRLGEGAAPHGVVIGPDQAAWITEGGQNAIARIDNETHKVELFRLPAGWAHAHLNTGVFDKSGIYWFTGQGGVLGRLDPASGRLEVWEAPRGPGPYGITSTPENEVWYASLAGSFIARLDRETRRSEIVEPPVPDQGARRIWSDSKGRLWISEWNAGNVSAYDPAAKYWQYWRVPGEQPRPYAVYVDNQDIVWLSDHAANAVLRFDPLSETFTSFPSSKPGASVRQLDGRPGEVWGGESGLDRLVRIETVSAS